MNLDFSLKKLEDADLEMTLFVNKEKMNMLDFICHMQFEYFSSFFVSALIDVHTLHKEPFRTIVFPVFRHAAFRDAIVFRLSYDEGRGGLGGAELSAETRSRYYRVMREKDSLVFFPSRKQTVQSLSELLIPENKVFLQKLLKGVFETVFLMLSATPRSSCAVACRNEFLFFILAHDRDGRTERIPKQQDLCKDERKTPVQPDTRLRVREKKSLHQVSSTRGLGHQELIVVRKNG
ncbi:hypothetical protein EBZ80_10410 [bacterium]|nr:hypothetical protein [bacterium]